LNLRGIPTNILRNPGCLKAAEKIKKPYFYFKVRPCSECKLTPLMKMELTEYSETSAYKVQMPGNHPKDRKQQEPLCLRIQAHDSSMSIFLNRLQTLLS